MATRLPLPVVMVVPLLALLLHTVSASTVPHIEMVPGSNTKYNSSSNDICSYTIVVGTVDYVGADMVTFTFDVYDKYGKSIHVSAGVRIDRPVDIVEGIDGPCIDRPCNLVVTADGKRTFADAMLNYVDVQVTGGGGNHHVMFSNTAQQWIGPGYGMQLQINNCGSSMQ